MYGAVNCAASRTVSAAAVPASARRPTTVDVNEEGASECGIGVAVVVITWKTFVVGRSLGATLIRALLLALALLLASQYLISPVRAYGISMQPTVEPGAWLWLFRLAYLRQSPRRGDIVAVNLPGGRAVLVKRVVGLPGERIAITDGVVLVNGIPLAEPYVTERQPWNVRDVQLDPHEFYVIGDNRGMPAPLHDFGRAARSRIAGRVFQP